jgi:hypothetical protein
MSSNEKYINYYVELLGSTLNDAVLRNISLQANAKLSQDVLQENKDREQELLAQINDLTNNRSEQEKKYVEEIAALNTALFEVQSKLDGLNQSKVEYDNAKHQLAHLDTFRNELIKSQKELGELKNQLTEKDILIGTLKKKSKVSQATSAKRKKLEDERIDSLFFSESIENNIVTSNIEDGGSF